MNASGFSSALAVVIAAAAVRQATPGRRRAFRRAACLVHEPSMAATAAGLVPPAGPRHDRPPAGTGPLAPPAPALAVTPPRRVTTALADAGFTVNPARAWSSWLVSLAVAAVAGAAAGGAGAAAVAVVAVLATPLVVWRLLRRRADDRLEAALPAAVDAVARSLRSGVSLRLAIAEAAAVTPGPLGAELGSVARSIQRGSSVVAALEAWGERQPAPGVRLVVSALCLGAETGGALARAVDGVAATLRQRLAARAEARALATQARASAAVLAAAPLAFTAVTSLADARTATFLFRTPTGVLCLAGGLALDAAGALWMARLTRIEVA